MKNEIQNSEFRVQNSYAFLLDASACSGCKACQVACKDKNQLAPGVLWRRVYEVTGGSWKQEGAAWTSTVFAYNLSLSCNHCEHPKCAGVCPVDAYSVRKDGIVLLDTSKCIGCGYCAWACPYGAPQYDAAAGHMTKCDFCIDNLEVGLPPACVASCPLRALDFAATVEGQARAAGHVAMWEVPSTQHPYPMLPNTRTRPHIAIKPHAAMASTEERRLANREEVVPRPESPWREAPLVAFTLLMQAAVGGFWAMLFLMPDVRLWLSPMLLIGGCVGLGMLASFAHLGTKRNAWRALNHLRKSWLSREILFTLLFGAGWLATFISMLLRMNIPVLGWLSALVGLELIYCMARVYHLRTVPAWNSWRTNARFYISAALLGTLGVLPVAAGGNSVLPGAFTGLVVIALLMAQAVLERSDSLSAGHTRLQFELILTGMLGCAAVFFLPGGYSLYSCLALLLVVLAQQVMERWSFYQARQ